MFKQAIKSLYFNSFPKYIRREFCSSLKPDVSSHAISVGNYNIHYKKAGKGPQTTLCLPGALGSGESDFGPQLSGLAGDDVTLIAWDPPGYGQSRPPNRQFTLDFLNKDAETAANFMKALGYQQYGLLGWSDGGITAMIMAANYNESISRLAVWGANAFIDETDVKLYKGLRDVSAWSPRMRAPMEAMYGVDGFKMMWEQWVDTLLALHQEKDGDLCRAELKRITCPSLVIHGKKDPVAPVSHAHYLAQEIPNARLHLFEEGKHNLHLKFAAEFNYLVSNFLVDGK